MTAPPVLPEHTHWMRHALTLAHRAATEFDEIPVGAVLISPEGTLLGEGCNYNITSHDPSAHAEIMALRAAGHQLRNHRMPGCTLYVTLEPCLMCAMAIIHARIAHLIYAATDPKTGACGSTIRHPQRPTPQPPCPRLRRPPCRRSLTPPDKLLPYQTRPTATATITPPPVRQHHQPSDTPQHSIHPPIKHPSHPPRAPTFLTLQQHTSQRPNTTGPATAGPDNTTTDHILTQSNWRPTWATP